MSRFIEWLDHRMDVVGIENGKELSELTGITRATLREIRDIGALDIFNRTQRRVLAAALRVRLGKLELLNAGRIDWIDDDDIWQVESVSRPLPWQEDDPAYWAPREIEPQDRGTPLIGRIRLAGQAEPDEDWHQEWGRHIPKRFGKGHSIYALEFDSTGASVVFRQVQPWEFVEGKAVVYCWNGFEGQGWFGKVCLQPFKPYVLTPDGQRHELDLSNITRLGKVIGRWPEEAGELKDTGETTAA